MELAEGFVAYIVSQEQLPDLAYEAVANERDLPPEGGGYVPGNTTNVQRQPAQQQQQLRMPGVAANDFSPTLQKYAITTINRHRQSIRTMITLR